MLFINGWYDNILGKEYVMIFESIWTGANDTRYAIVMQNYSFSHSMVRFNLTLINAVWEMERFNLNLVWFFR